MDQPTLDQIFDEAQKLNDAGAIKESARVLLRAHRRDHSISNQPRFVDLVKETAVGDYIADSAEFYLLLAEEETDPDRKRNFEERYKREIAAGKERDA